MTAQPPWFSTAPTASLASGLTWLLRSRLELDGEARHFSVKDVSIDQAEVAPAPVVSFDEAQNIVGLRAFREDPIRGSISLRTSEAAQRNDGKRDTPNRSRPSGASSDSRRIADGAGDAGSASLSMRLAAVLQLSVDHLLSPNGPLAWPNPLLPYQIDGIKMLVDRPSLLLADDMGLGKTIQALAALRVLIFQTRISSALVIVPAGLISQWRSEIRRWAPELRVSTIQGLAGDRAWQWKTPAHIYLVSYETLRSDFSESPHAPVSRVWDVVVLDEAQKIKNADTDLSRVCKRLRRERQWALTGTPLENRIDDLMSILSFVNPASVARSRLLPTTEDLKEELGQVQLRRRKADVLLDLPPKLVSRVVLQLAPRQRQSYDRAEREGVIQLRELGATIQIQNVLELILRLKQICNFCPVSGESSKLSDAQERVDTLAAQGYKALVFTQFANDQNGARAIANQLTPTALTYTGDHSQAERDEILRRFRTDSQQVVLVLSLRAGGQGLNLQEASYVFHFDRWWNPAVEGQAEARSHRMGQQHPVNVYTYTCENTIEERIEQILQEKQLLFDELVDGVSIDVSKALNQDELFGLFGLKAPKQ